MVVISPGGRYLPDAMIPRIRELPLSSDYRLGATVVKLVLFVKSLIAGPSKLIVNQ
jgi:hypothetical protein